MKFPTVSVIIPAHNGEDHLGEAIQTVLDQTYSRLELIVVDDASQDNTVAVLDQFQDKRLRSIVLDENKGADFARMVGVQASSGEIIAFLDQDDFFHKDKLAEHVDYLRDHPDVGFSYNPYFNLNHSCTTIRDISTPPQDITLEDLIQGFPLPPSVWVLRRQWVTRDELWEEETFLHGSEIIFCGRLFMAGCKFGMVDRVLNYRRYHAGRIFYELAQKCETELSCQDLVFSDPRCPTETRNLRDVAYANIYLMWAYVALKQEETELGRMLIMSGLKANPSLLVNDPCELTKFILIYSIDEEAENHERILKSIFDQLPAELNTLFDQQGWAVAQGYLLKGVRAMIWDREPEGCVYLERASELNAEVDELFLETVVLQLMAYESFYGSNKTKKIVRQLESYFERFIGNNGARTFRSFYSHFRAINHFRREQYKRAVRNSLRAVFFNPRRIMNRGLISIIIRSSYRSIPKPSDPA